MKTAGKAPAVLPGVLLGRTPVRQAVKLPQRTLRLSANLPTLTREMPLNISIDVDGTLLDESDNLIPLALEKLLELKLKGHRLQLWSSAGAEYARQVAEKHLLTEVFDSYGTKPDVAFDDLPESTRSVAIPVSKTFGLADAIDMLQSDLADCYEGVLHPSASLVRHVKEVQNSWVDVKEHFKAKLELKPVPIPFFGNLEHARLITVGLNPSPSEFVEGRQWPAILSADELTFRLVNYFRLSGDTLPPPHNWFKDILQAAHSLGCPTSIAIAHVDLCPWAAFFPKSTDLRTIFGNCVDEQMHRWLAKVFQHCRSSAKLVVVIQSDNPSPIELERQREAKQIIRTALGDPSWRGEIIAKSRRDFLYWASLRKEPIWNPLWRHVR